jgi:hypothetical protein
MSDYEARTEDETRHDYRPPPYQPYPGLGARLSYLRRQYPVETRPFYLTSEFAAALIAIVALAITAGASSTIDAWRFWQLATAITVGYLLSRGIAKAGSHALGRDPRNEIDGR